MIQKIQIVVNDEWTKEMTNAVATQSWGEATRTFGQVAALVGLSMFTAVLTSTVVIAPLAGCITACVGFFALGIYGLIAALNKPTQEVEIVARKQIESLRPPSGASIHPAP
jgi:hypothetical protein